MIHSLEPYLEIGIILKPQGLQGEVKVQPVTDDPNRFLSLECVYMKRGEAFARISVLSASVRGEAVYLHLTGVEGRDAAEKLRGEALYIDREHAVKSDPDAVFIADLIWCSVVDETGRRIGFIRDVQQPGASDVYEIETPGGLLWVPVLRDVVTGIDTEAGVVTLDAVRLNETAVWEHDNERQAD